MNQIRIYVRSMPGFHKEPVVSDEMQVVKCVEFFKSHVEKYQADWNPQAIVYHDEGNTAMLPLNMRPGGLSLIRDSGYHDCILTYSLATMFDHHRTVLEELGRLHRRRTVVYALDAIPFKALDTATQTIQSWEPMENIRALRAATIGKLNFDKVAGDDPQNHPWVKWNARKRKRGQQIHAQAPINILRHHEGVIKMMAEFRHRGWRWIQIRTLLKFEKLIDNAERRRKGWSWNKFRRLAEVELRKIKASYPQPGKVEKK